MQSMSSSLAAHELRLQPRAVLLQHLLGQGREELQHLEERSLLLDDAVDGGVAHFDGVGHGRFLSGPGCAKRRMVASPPLSA